MVGIIVTSTSSSRAGRAAGVSVAPHVTPIGPRLGEPFLEKNTADVASVRQLDIDERAPVRIRAATWANAIAAARSARNLSRAALPRRRSLSHSGSDSSGVSMEMRRHFLPLSRPVSPSIRHVWRCSTEHNATGPSRFSPSGSVKRSHAATAAKPRHASRTPTSSRVRRRVAVDVPRRCPRPRPGPRARTGPLAGGGSGPLCEASDIPRATAPTPKKAFRRCCGIDSSVECPEALADALRKGLEATPGIEPGCADLQSATSPLRHVAPTSAAPKRR